MGRAVCKKTTVFVVMVLMVPSTAVDAGPYDPPATYYDGATGTGATLKNQLQTIMTSGHIQRSYGDFRYSAAITDADPNVPGNILLVYDRASVSGQWNLGGQLPWNREHVWPQSLQPGSASNGTKGNLGDPHSLRPADTQINSNRGHRAFGFENTTGSHGTIGSAYYFPGDADRGDIARQLFYSTTRYASLGLTLVEGVPSGNEMGDFSSLLAWHYLDTPDDFELRRNHAIYSSSLNPSYYTNNRNAYIDRPEYVWSVFVDQQNDSRIVLDGAAVDGNGASTLDLSLGRVLVGAAVPAAQAVEISKLGSDGTYFSVTTSAAATSTLDGRYNAFRTGGTDSKTFDVGLDASTFSAGQRSGSVTINNLDVTTSGGTGRGANDADDVVHVTLDVLDHANPSFVGGGDLNSLTYDFGAFDLGSELPVWEFDFYNLESTAGYTVGLELDAILVEGEGEVLAADVDIFGGSSALLAGMSTSFAATFDTSTAGVFSAVYTFMFSDEDLPGASSLDPLQLTLTGTIEEQTADIDQDGDIDGNDFLLIQRTDPGQIARWQLEYGPSVLGRTAAVPEPTAVVVFLIGMAFLSSTRMCKAVAW